MSTKQHRRGCANNPAEVNPLPTEVALETGLHLDNESPAMAHGGTHYTLEQVVFSPTRVWVDYFKWKENNPSKGSLRESAVICHWSD